MGAQAIKPEIVQIGVGQPGVAAAHAPFVGVDVVPYGQRIQRHISKYCRLVDAVLVKHRSQMAAIAFARFAAGTLDALPGTRS